jgi:hypothetical protein
MTLGINPPNPPFSKGGIKKQLLLFLIEGGIKIFPLFTKEKKHPPL